MAVVLMEGFDHFDGSTAITKGWSHNNGSSGAGRFSGRRITSQNTLINYKNLPSSYSTLYAGFAFYADGGPFIQDIFMFRAGSTDAVRIDIAQPGSSKILRVLNSAGTVLATGTTPLSIQTWYYIELGAVIHASTGTVELRLNGSTSPEASASSVNTGSSNIDNVGLRWANGQTHSYDDLYVVDTSGSSPTNTWLGDVRIETLAPNGNGANTAWTGSYTDIDDSTTYDSDTTYISSLTPGDRETSTLANLAVASGTVFAVQTNLIARKDDAGSRTIAPVIRIGSTDYDGTTTASLGSSYLDYTQLYDRLDPSGAGWTISTVNAMEAGVKEVA